MFEHVAFWAADGGDCAMSGQHGMCQVYVFMTLMPKCMVKYPLPRARFILWVYGI